MRFSHCLLVITALLLLIRLFTLGMYPLYDTTEARYAEIARLMVQSQDWITPWFDINVPFWGKPPAHTWITALSFEIFGINEWSARFAHWLMGAATVALLFAFTKRILGQTLAIYSSFILVTCLGFFVATSMVMTDPALLFASTLAMTSFWLCYTEKSRLAGLVFFFACGLGMLIKGPVAVVIIGIALVVWAIWQNQLLNAIKSLPWVLGLTVFIVTFAPWYLLAEQKTPGFINYFIIGEHIQRFLEPGWQGDLYGSAHLETKGTIWLFWLGVACPWSFILIFKLLTAPKQLKALCKIDLNRYLIAWTIAPMLLFSLANNILSAYVLPGLPAFALLMAIVFSHEKQLAVSNRPVLQTTADKQFLTIGLVCLALYSLIITAVIKGWHSKYSEIELLEVIAKPCPSVPVFYIEKRPFSARFYSCGKAQLIEQVAELSDILNTQKQSYLVLTHTQKKILTLPSTHTCLTINTSQKGVLLTCTQKSR